MSAKYVSKIQAALDKLGKNGTAIPDGSPPSDVKSNSDVEAWHNKHKAVGEYLIASNIARIGKAREERAKKNVEKLLNLDSEKRVPGSSVNHVFDNVSLNVKISNPRMLLDRSKLMTALTLTGKLNAEEVAKVIASCETESTPPRTLTASTTAE
jgi:hypothetical protein